MFKKGDIVKVVNYDNLNKNEYNILKTYDTYIVYRVNNNKILINIKNKIYSFPSYRFLKIKDGDYKQNQIIVYKKDLDIIKDIYDKTYSNKMKWIPIIKERDMEFIYTKKITKNKSLFFKIIIYGEHDDNDKDVTDSVLIINYYNNKIAKNVKRYTIVEHDALIDVYYYLLDQIEDSNDMNQS